MDPPSKQCRGPCGVTHPLSHFRRNGRTPDGHESVCKSCRGKTDRRQKLRKRYGLTVAEYNAMAFAQDYCCAICRKPPPRGVLQVDHCHRTGRVRALLCGPCNRAIGLLRDNPNTIARAATFAALQKEVEEDAA